ncbi:MAG: HEPN domain-containing protein [Chlorobi bacterium]|nr:HEPN domain-containing protein [Chlorobiota bacterium]
MREETKYWLKFAKENLDAANVLLESSLFNPCLQNIQQSVEKTLKALLIEHAIGLLKTHSITELVELLAKNNFDIDITEDDCDLLDSIYLSTKYPVGSVLPDFEPDNQICIRSLEIAKMVLKDVKDKLN